MGDSRASASSRARLTRWSLGPRGPTPNSPPLAFSCHDLKRHAPRLRVGTGRRKSCALNDLFERSEPSADGVRLECDVSYCELEKSARARGLPFQSSAPLSAE